ncbi:uncharacterized protein METZ01_LOCUS449919, partial [marine metagenome]
TAVLSSELLLIDVTDYWVMKVELERWV